ncbi:MULTISPECIES: serpin family protein [Thermocrispum]|jgi:serpin B|uniref:Serpin family protein n=1 Tax=Thermocrispum agreste TaxID=37925 RepID=A0A2W4LUU0_9PSEU|nr:MULTISPECIES: serpin family protein [Thermocrispum]PZM99426.1 MAG: serpin family protein [Thermocrispum agreste]
MADPPAERRHLQFTLDLHRVIGAGGGTVCFSPYSVESALGMVYQAARGATAEELQGLLDPDATDIGKQVELLRTAAVLSSGRGGDQPVLEVSNTLWAWEQLPLNESFTVELAGWPGAKVATAPFVTDPEAARRAINDDVARTTRNLITDLVPEGAVDSSTVASLVNALYLKVGWRHPFAEHETAEEPFATPSGERRVPMMHQVDRFGYASAAGWTAVSLPAAGGVEAVALLPDGELTEAEAHTDAATLAAVLSELRARRVSLWLPRLRVKTNVGLTDVLSTLGVRTLFTPQADLSGLSSDPRLTVSDALHESVLRVDEKGLEGAAATAMMVRMTSVIVESPVEVRFDRPFLLLVRHAASGAVYFVARVADPG